MVATGALKAHSAGGAASPRHQARSPQGPVCEPRHGLGQKHPGREAAANTRARSAEAQVHAPARGTR